MYQIIKDLRVGILARPQINNKLIYKTLQKTPKLNNESETDQFEIFHRISVNLKPEWPDAE